ncbi:hypothetical protein HUX88_03120 [Duganella sp. BJB1802]|uniref:hypothetical protein n=1 Tax=Duganella sp. BJB1802 TaxID=2744575 RepID=UPI0015948A6B|nr:hypothetical protein [Duganella sp. BJB1802]NVD69548.1 hypothetical protein [Duganella sp. BJB1802]
MFPISSTPASNVTPLGPLDADLVTAIGSSTDAPAPAAVTVDLSPVANFLLTVSQTQQHLAQLQAALAQGAAPPNSDTTLSDRTRDVVDAFNLLPSAETDRAQGPESSLLDTLVQSLQPPAVAQNLAQIGLSLQATLPPDAHNSLSLDDVQLQTAFHTAPQATAATLQATLGSFDAVAENFAARLAFAQQNDPLGANPALAAAIAAYRINDIAGAASHLAQTAGSAIPRVPAVAAPARTRANGHTP